MSSLDDAVGVVAANSTGADRDWVISCWQVFPSGSHTARRFCLVVDVDVVVLGMTERAASAAAASGPVQSLMF